MKNKQQISDSKLNHLILSTLCDDGRKLVALVGAEKISRNVLAATSDFSTFCLLSTNLPA